MAASVLVMCEVKSVENSFGHASETFCARGMSFLETMLKWS